MPEIGWKILTLQRDMFVEVAVHLADKLHFVVKGVVLQEFLLLGWVGSNPGMLEQNSRQLQGVGKDGKVSISATGLTDLPDLVNHEHKAHDCNQYPRNRSVHLYLIP